MRYVATLRIENDATVTVDRRNHTAFSLLAGIDRWRPKTEQQQNSHSAMNTDEPILANQLIAINRFETRLTNPSIDLVNTISLIALGLVYMIHINRARQIVISWFILCINLMEVKMWNHLLVIECFQALALFKWSNENLKKKSLTSTSGPLSLIKTDWFEWNKNKQKICAPIAIGWIWCVHKN